MAQGLQAEFEQLLKAPDRAKRGKDFEALIFRLLFEHGFYPTRNPKAAAPRQTDLYAQHQGRDYLIETKWIGTRIGSPEIGDLRDRIRNTSPGVIGCIISMSEYNKKALDYARQHRAEHTILLFDPGEIEGLIGGRVRLARLIDQKLTALRRDGEIWFAHQKQDAPGPIIDPPPAEETLHVGGRRIDHIIAKASTDLIFTRDILQYQEGGGPDESGVALSLSLGSRHNIERMRHVASAIQRTLGISGNGSYAIKNSGTVWHGIGIANFLDAILEFKPRYAEAPRGKQYHYAEVARYLGECRGGFVELETQPLLARKVFRQTELTIHLPGIPVDLAPYTELCREVGADGFFRVVDASRAERWYTANDRCMLRRPVRLEALGEVIYGATGDLLKCDVVSGLICRNPFFGRPDEVAKLVKHDNSPLRCLPETDTLVCFLSDWIDRGDIVDNYVLTEIDGSHLNGIPVLRPVCTWGKIIKGVATPEERVANPDPTVKPTLKRLSRKKVRA